MPICLVKSEYSFRTFYYPVPVLGGCMAKTIDCNEQGEHFLPLDVIRDIYQQGGLFVYPTETLYGLGADPFNEKALGKLYSVKQRPREMPVSIAVSSISMMKRFGEVNSNLETIAQHLLPGPVTVLLRALDDIPRNLTKDNRIGLRIPDHPIPLNIIESIGPITATSANIHSKPAPQDIKEAMKQLGDGVDLYMDCGESKHKGPSTIVDCSESSISIIRKGVIPEKEIRALFK
jgi:L-threonylcarbamoyladenylate synthase